MIRKVKAKFDFSSIISVEFESKKLETVKIKKEAINKIMKSLLENTTIDVSDIGDCDPRQLSIPTYNKKEKKFNV